MLQIANLNEYTEADIPQLLEKIQPILNKRKQLHECYTREATQSKPLFSGVNSDTNLPLEKYIVDLATGYLAGKPIYSVEASKDDDRKRIIETLLDKVAIDDETAKQMKVVIDYISDYNDDEQENYDLIHDINELTACYEILYENEDNEIVYSRYSPLQTVATWDYNIPANLTGLVRTWCEKDLNANIITKVELTDINGSRTYAVNGPNVVLEEQNNHEWGDVPAFAVENDIALFEGSEDLIRAYEQLIQNVRNTYQYNDADCKLMFVGYQPQNSLTTINNDGEEIENPARIKEDNYMLKSRTIFVGDNGDVRWLSKPVDAAGTESILKMYLDRIFQLGYTPNTADLAFNSADMNASAIDRKFYVMDMMTTSVRSLLKKAYLRRWELIFNRINFKKSTNFDFRNINIDLPKNLPSNSSEIADFLLKLEGKISDETIIERLGFDYLSEKAKIENESEDKLQETFENMNMEETDEQQAIPGQEMEIDRDNIDETVSEVQEDI